MNIRLARMGELDQIMENYHLMSAYPGQFEHGAGWVKDLYPTTDMIEQSIQKEEYHLVEIDGKIAAGMSLNEEYTEGYDNANWLIDAKEGEFLSIHALGVMPEYRGQSLARHLVRHAIKYARDHHYKAIRIDVLDRNDAAKKLYPSEGFQWAGKIELYYEDTGLTDYYMYEYIIQEV